MNGGTELKKSKHDKEMEKFYEDIRGRSRESERNSSDLKCFFLGLLMFGAGLFMIFQNAQVRSNLGYGGYFYHIGNWNVPNGLIMLPLIAGIFMLFMMEKRIFGWIVTILGIIFILMTILMNVRIEWRTTSAYVFVIMFGLTAAGGGLLMRALFRKR